jgi:asparagine synthase (glutamine-hydrolysing)
MFAFAVFDSQQHELFLARDRFGVKPLYYSSLAGDFRFASQVKALLAAGVPQTVDKSGMAGFLLWGSVPEPFTMFEHVRGPAGGIIHESAPGTRGRAVNVVPCRRDLGSSWI